MSHKITQAEWDARALERGFEWLIPVKAAHVPTPARCLECGYEWRSRPSGYHRRRGCPDCAGQAPISRETRDAQAAAVNARWIESPNNSSTPAAILCLECGHEWKAPAMRIALGHGCPPCSYRVRGEQRRTSQAEWREIAQAAGLEFLTDEVLGFEKCRTRCCECGYEWEVMPQNVRGGRGCPECGKEKSGKARRLSAAEWNSSAAKVGLLWLEPVGAGRTKVLARCLECGYEWKADPRSVRMGRGCPSCARNIAVTQLQRDREAEVAGLTWLEPIGGALAPALARCNTCGLEWRTRPNRVQQGHGCPSCATPGFDPSKPAYLYLIAKDDGTAKVGITGVAKVFATRMANHNRSGYYQVRRWLLEPGALARQIEQKTITRWREEDGLSPAAPEGEVGYTETVSTALLPIQEIIARIDALVEDVTGAKGA